MVKNRKLIMIAVCLVIALILAAAGGIYIFGKKGYTVGKNIGIDDIAEFYFTRSTSVYPPHYQRYRFFMEDGKHMFFHETREGDTFPLTEKYTTETGTIELTDAQWQEFFGYISGGTVVQRTESITSGDSGPWMYLYWKKDRSKYQEFYFDSYGSMTEFEEFCIRLKENQ